MANSIDDSLRSLSLDYLNLLINGQAFSDVTFSVDGRLVHAHRCILAARSPFFRRFFCSGGPDVDPQPPRGAVHVASVGYDVFLLVLQFLYCGHASLVPHRLEPAAAACGDRACGHEHCAAAVDLALETLAAARSFGVEQLALITQGLDLDRSLALHYAVENCSREVVKALLELGPADVNLPAGPAGRTPLHVAAEMVSPEMVAVLLDHHADPNRRAADGTSPLDVLRALTSDFLFRGAGGGGPAARVEPNKLRLCLELVQSAASVISREEEKEGGGDATATAVNRRGGGSVYSRDRYC
ncbi:Regulatory protein NPR6 [Striga hermonthica]|uniref:Regulatory protein NPR6 n=1 Tax=Striga hermonthica TaxID=68872 RepID=A0A9N7RHA7_STRHE|nr:Regulatory protein NPR6 [Striga hermonthica]